MKIEGNDLYSAAQHRPVEKRKWSAPRVIESDLSNTQAPRASVRNSLDYVYYLNFGS